MSNEDPTPCSTILDTISGGIQGAVTGAVSAAVGAAILQSAGYDNYNVAEATAMGTVGNAILSGSVGFLKNCGFFKGKPTKDSCSFTIGFVGQSTLGALLGQAILASKMALTLGKAAASQSVGASVMALPILAAYIAIDRYRVNAGYESWFKSETETLDHTTTPRR